MKQPPYQIANCDIRPNTVSTIQVQSKNQQTNIRHDAQGGKDNDNVTTSSEAATALANSETNDYTKFSSSKLEKKSSARRQGNIPFPTQPIIPNLTKELSISLHTSKRTNTQHTRTIDCE